ncbi:MAG: PDZ domain-containing protein [Phycisphaerales bacterium JB063]
MKRTALTTAALLAAALALPSLAEEAPAAPAQAEHEVVVVETHDGEAVEVRRIQRVRARAAEVEPANDVFLNVEVVGEPGVDGAEGGQIRIVMIDKDGNIIEHEDGIALQWVEGAHMPLPGVDVWRVADPEGQVFLREIALPDVVGQAPVNPPMVEATYLGLNCEPLDFDTAALLLVDEGTGLSVTFVAEDSPAAAAGLEAGDTLLKLDDQVLINPEQLAVLIRTHEAGESVTLLVVREGDEFELEAELGTSTVPQLGPGGRNLSQFWNVERRAFPGEELEFHVMPEAIHGRLAQINPDIEDIEVQIERIEALLAERARAMPNLDELRRNADAMREQMRVHEEAIRQMIEQLHGQHGQLDELHEFEFEGNAAMNIVWNDGEHTIKISGDGEGSQTLHVTDAEGNVLYDGAMPEGEAIDELPDGVGDKVREMQGMHRFEFRREGAPEAPEAPEAPTQPNADA